MTGHLSTLERRAALEQLGIQALELMDRPFGAILGEMPGTNTSPRLPMFPTTSAGARLLAYSRMDVVQYLSRLARRNLFHLFSAWSVVDGRHRARAARAWMGGMRVSRAVLLGNRVASAFGAEMWRPFEIVAGGRSIQAIAIPHPSGRNHVYNQKTARRRAGAAVRWAAHLQETP